MPSPRVDADVVEPRHDHRTRPMSAPDEATGSRGEVEALALDLWDAGLIRPEWLGREVVEFILASDWLAQRDAAQRAEAAQAVLDAVEGVANLLGYSYDSAQYVAAARAAAARFGVAR
jgi:hypothetical protein